MNPETIKKKFSEAGLLVEITKDPFVGGVSGRDIVQLDIQRKIKKNARSEYFRLFLGAEGNIVDVVSTDKKICQLVLMIKEPARYFTRREWDKKLRKHVEVQDRTTDSRRHILLGLDERQLFIATLPRAITTVAEAHKSLKGANVTLAEGRVDGRTIRQGEWFFLNVTQEERDAINREIRKNRLFIKKKTAIGRSRNPHIADELVELPGRELSHGFSVRQRDEIFVRGAVKHVDHATVKFSQWRRVIRNAEPGNGNGINWID